MSISQPGTTSVEGKQNTQAALAQFTEWFWKTHSDDYAKWKETVQKRSQACVPSKAQLTAFMCFEHCTEEYFLVQSLPERTQTIKRIASCDAFACAFDVVALVQVHSVQCNDCG
jgi:hypothetical protein